MKKSRDSTIIYRSFFEAITELPVQNQAEIWRAIFELSFNGNDESEKLSSVTRGYFILIKPLIEANNKKYNDGKKGGKYGKMGGRPSNPTGDKTVNPTGDKKPDESETPNADKDVYKDKDKDVNEDEDKEEIKSLPKKPAEPKNIYHSTLKNIFISQVPKYYWTPKDAKLLNELTKKLIYRMQIAGLEINEQSISENFKLTIAAARAEKWLNQNFSIPNINSKFNELTIRQPEKTFSNELDEWVKGAIARDAARNNSGMEGNKNQSEPIAIGRDTPQNNDIGTSENFAGNGQH